MTLKVVLLIAATAVAVYGMVMGVRRKPLGMVMAFLMACAIAYYAIETVK